MYKVLKNAFIAAISLGLASGFVATPANAETTPSALVRFTNPVVERTINETSHEVSYLAGEFIQISTNVSFKNTALSTHVTAGNKLTVNTGIEIKSGSPLTGVSQRTSINGGAGNSSFNNSSSGTNPEFTLSSAPTYLSATISYAGTATTNVTIKFDPTFTVSGYTFLPADFSSTNIDANTGLFMPGSKQNAPVVGHSIDTAIRFFPEDACVDTSELAQGNVLEATFDVNDGIGQVGTKNFRWAVTGADGMPTGMPGMNSTFTVPTISPGSKMTFSGDVKITPVTEGKTYTFAGYKVFKQGTTKNLLTHCKETLATGVLSVSGSTVTGTLTTTADASGVGMGMSGFDSYACTLYAVADTSFATPVKSGSANRYALSGMNDTPACNVREVPAGTYKMGIRGFSWTGMGSEKILDGTITVTGGAVTPAKKAPKAPAVATKVKIGKTITVALHATKGTATKGANSDGLATTVKVAPSSGGFCSVTAVKKSGKITGYTVKGLNAGKCSVLVTITGSSTFNALSKTIKVTVSK